jgi:hypothetical protein
MFLLGVIIGGISAIFNMYGVTINSTIGTMFLLLAAPTPVAFGYWAVSQGLVLTGIIPELFYVEDKDLDENQLGCVELTKQKGETLFVVEHLIDTEKFLVVFKAALISIIGLQSSVISQQAEVFKAGIKGISFILAIIIVYNIGKKLLELDKEEKIKYAAALIAGILLFSLIQHFNIAVYNSIPLLLGVIFADLPAFYNNREPIVWNQIAPGKTSAGFMKMDSWYLFWVALANLGIGTSKLANFVSVEETSAHNEAYNLSLGKLIAAFISTLLWLLFASTRSATEEALSMVDIFLLKEYWFAIVVVMVASFLLMCTLKDLMIDQIQQPLSNNTKTINNIMVLFVMFCFALSPELNLITAGCLCALGILLNILVNKMSIPNSALSFVTTYVPISSMFLGFVG